MSGRDEPGDALLEFKTGRDEPGDALLEFKTGRDEPGDALLEFKTGRDEPGPYSPKRGAALSQKILRMLSSESGCRSRRSIPSGQVPSGCG